MSIKKKEVKKPALQKGRESNQPAAGKAQRPDAKKNSFSPKKK